MSTSGEELIPPEDSPDTEEGTSNDTIPKGGAEGGRDFTASGAIVQSDTTKPREDTSCSSETSPDNVSSVIVPPSPDASDTEENTPEDSDLKDDGSNPDINKETVVQTDATSSESKPRSSEVTSDKELPVLVPPLQCSSDSEEDTPKGADIKDDERNLDITKEKDVLTDEISSENKPCLTEISHDNGLEETVPPSQDSSESEEDTTEEDTDLEYDERDLDATKETIVQFDTTFKENTPCPSETTPDDDDVTCDKDDVINETVDDVQETVSNAEPSFALDVLTQDELLAAVFNGDIAKVMAVLGNEDDMKSESENMEDIGPKPYDRENAGRPIEEDLLSAVYNGDMTSVIEILGNAEYYGLNLEYRDSNGNTPLRAAIQEGYAVIVERLLKHNVVIGDGLLRAVDVGFLESVRQLTEYAMNLPSKEVRKAILTCHCEDDTFHPDVTPIVLAAQRNDFAMVKLLLDSGCRILDVSSKEYSTSATDSLQQSVGTLEIYKGLASEAYVALATIDPIDNTFVLSNRLQQMSRTDVEFKSSYLELIDTLNQVGTDIVSQARSTEEILTVLTYYDRGKNHNSDMKLEPLPKLSRAIRYEQREFVAAPNCQQTVKTKFYGRLSAIRDYNTAIRCLFFLLISISFPVLSILYLISPTPKIKQLIECPYTKLSLRLTSDLLFVIIITADAVLHGGLNPSVYIFHPVRFFLLLWTLGIGWEEVMRVWKKGRSCLLESKHIRDTTLVVLLLAAITVDALMYYNSSRFFRPETEIDSTKIKRSINQNVPNNLPIYQNISTYDWRQENDTLSSELIETKTLHRIPTIPDSKRGAKVVIGSGPAEEDKIGQLSSNAIHEYLSYKWWHPHLVTTCMFAMACVFAYLRILPYVVISDVIGPLQISLGTMVTQTLHFFLVVALVMIAFAMGFTFIYSYHDEVKMQICVKLGDADSCRMGNFANLFHGLVYLYWSIFGLESLTSLDLDKQARTTQMAGYVLYAMFYILMVIVLMNALIAVMSNSYNEVEENGDVEWKFACTSMFMGFMAEGDVIPPPFNLLPSIENWKNLYALIKKQNCVCRKKEPPPPFNGKMKVINEGRRLQRPKSDGDIVREEESQYQRIIRLLVERYVAEKTAGEVSVEADISIADIRALRNDLLALKMEMSDRLLENTEDIDRTFGTSVKTKRQSEHAKRVFSTTEAIHNAVATHLESVRGFKTDVGVKSEDLREEEIRLKKEEERLKKEREAEDVRRRLEMEAREERFKKEMAKEEERLRTDMDEREKRLKKEMQEEKERLRIEMDDNERQLREIEAEKAQLEQELKEELEQLIHEKETEKQRLQNTIQDQEKQYSDEIKAKDDQLQKHQEDAELLREELNLKMIEVEATRESMELLGSCQETEPQFDDLCTQTDSGMSTEHNMSQTEELKLEFKCTQTEVLQTTQQDSQTECKQFSLQEIQTDICSLQNSDESTQTIAEYVEQFAQTEHVLANTHTQTELLLAEQSIQTEKHDIAMSTQTETEQSEISTQTEIKQMEGSTQTQLKSENTQFTQTEDAKSESLATQTDDKKYETQATQVEKSECTQYTQTEPREDEPLNGINVSPVVSPPESPGKKQRRHNVGRVVSQLVAEYETHSRETTPTSTPVNTPSK